MHQILGNVTEIHLRYLQTIFSFGQKKELSQNIKYLLYNFITYIFMLIYGMMAIIEHFRTLIC